MVWNIYLQRDFSSVFVTVGVGHSPLAEKHLHMALAMEAREGPTIQDKGECLMAATGHLFEDMTATYHPHGVAGGWQCTSVARGVLDVFTLDCVNCGRFSFDGSVVGFIDEFVANVLCSLLASPVYVMVRLAENFSEHFDRTRVAAVRLVRNPS